MGFKIVIPYKTESFLLDSNGIVHIWKTRKELRIFSKEILKNTDEFKIGGFNCKNHFIIIPPFNSKKGWENNFPKYYLIVEKNDVYYMER